MKNEVAALLFAIQFLTRIPVPTHDLYSPERMAASVRYYPLVGALVGGLSAGVFWIGLTLFPPVLAIVLALAAGVLVTGAFHEDGLADTFDGIGGGLTREKALAIMKDSRLGTYGTLVLVATFALKAGALVVLTPSLIILALIAGHALSRLSSVLVIATSRYVRDEGTGKPVANGVTGSSFSVAVLIGALVCAGWCVMQSPASFVAGVAGLIVGHVLMRLFFEHKLGGYTGDTLGAVQQASEVGFYLGLAAWF